MFQVFCCIYSTIFKLSKLFEFWVYSQQPIGITTEGVTHIPYVLIKFV